MNGERDGVGQLVVGGDVGAETARVRCSTRSFVTSMVAITSCRPGLQHRPGAFQLALELAREIRIRVLDRQIGPCENRGQMLASREAKAGRRQRERTRRKRARCNPGVPL